jgi:hypothetical protein
VGFPWRTDAVGLFPKELNPGRNHFAPKLRAKERFRCSPKQHPEKTRFMSVCRNSSTFHFDSLYIYRLRSFILINLILLSFARSVGWKLLLPVYPTY